MHIQRLWLCLLENAQAAQCVTSQLVFDRLGDQAMLRQLLTSSWPSSPSLVLQELPPSS